jgi:hypothetical protein
MGTMAKHRSETEPPPTNECEAKGCTKRTRERKLYCPEHIMEDAKGYPKMLERKLEEVAEEIKKTRAHGPRSIDPRGTVAKEILSGIALVGSITWRRLLKDHVVFLNGASAIVTRAYLDRLRQEGLIEVTSSKRQDPVVSLTPRGLKIYGVR